MNFGNPLWHVFKSILTQTTPCQSPDSPQMQFPKLSPLLAFLRKKTKQLLPSFLKPHVPQLLLDRAFLCFQVMNWGVRLCQGALEGVCSSEIALSSPALGHSILQSLEVSGLEQENFFAVCQILLVPLVQSSLKTDICQL